MASDVWLDGICLVIWDRERIQDRVCSLGESDERWCRVKSNLFCSACTLRVTTQFDRVSKCRNNYAYWGVSVPLHIWKADSLWLNCCCSTCVLKIYVELELARFCGACVRYSPLEVIRGSTPSTFGKSLWEICHCMRDSKIVRIDWKHCRMSGHNFRVVSQIMGFPS